MLTKSVCFLFSGKAGTGKTTSADYVVNKSPEVFKVIKASVAHGVKVVALNGFRWNKSKDDKGRALLQGIGKVGREYNQDLWISTLLDENLAENKEYPFDIVCIDDWRYINELEYVKKDGLYQPVTIRIDAPNREILKGKDTYFDTSETELDTFSFDYRVDNSGTFAQLHNQLDFILQKTIKEYTFGDF